MPLKRAVTEFGKTYKDRFALRTYPGTSVPIFIFILGWSRTKPRVTLSAQTMAGMSEILIKKWIWPYFGVFRKLFFCYKRPPGG